MSSQIEEWRVKGFKSNVYTLAQQKGSRLRGAVRNEMQSSKADFYDRIGLVTATKNSTRHGDTRLFDTPHSRRMVTLSDFDHADLVDNMDKIRLINDSTSHYAKVFMYAFGRAMDDEILTAATGTAYSGEDGGTSVTFPDAQRTVSISTGTTQGALDVDALREAKNKLDAADIDPDIPRYCAFNAASLKSLLAETEVTSSDYNTVKALAEGKVDTFLGFKFILSNRLLTSGAVGSSFDTDGSVGAGAGTVAAGSKSVICWAQDGLLLSIGRDSKARVTERDDKKYSTQVFMDMSIGATRMEEAKIVEIIIP